jgi:hypothetical protein
MSNRKPRIQGKIDNLPPREREQVHEWFRQNLTYAQISKRIHDDFGVKVATSSLCSYYARRSEEIFAKIVNDPRPILQIEIGPQIEMGAVLLNREGRQLIQIFGRENPKAEAPQPKGSRSA